MFWEYRTWVPYRTPMTLHVSVRSRWSHSYACSRSELPAGYFAHDRQRWYWTTRFIYGHKLIFLFHRFSRPTGKKSAPLSSSLFGIHSEINYPPSTTTVKAVPQRLFLESITSSLGHLTFASERTCSNPSQSNNAVEGMTHVTTDILNPIHAALPVGADTSQQPEGVSIFGRIQSTINTSSCESPCHVGRFLVLNDHPRTHFSNHSSARPTPLTVSCSP